MKQQNKNDIEGTMWSQKSCLLHGTGKQQGTKGRKRLRTRCPLLRQTLQRPVSSNYALLTFHQLARQHHHLGAQVTKSRWEVFPIQYSIVYTQLEEVGDAWCVRKRKLRDEEVPPVRHSGLEKRHGCSRELMSILRLRK